MKTYTNQKVIHINKPNYTGNYLSVGIDEWAEASIALSIRAFKLYLYLCGNADGFNLALSRQAVMNLLKISKDTYLKAVDELEKKGYLVQKQGNIYDFYTTPMVAECHTVDEEMVAECHTGCMQDCIQDGSNSAYSMVAECHTEITKTTNINKLTKESERDFTNVKEEGAKAPEREEELEDTLEEELDSFDDGTLIQIRRRIEKGKTDKVNHGYKVIKKDYDIQNELSWDAVGIINGIIQRRINKKRQDEAIKNINATPNYEHIKNNDETINPIWLAQ